MDAAQFAARLVLLVCFIASPVLCAHHVDNLVIEENELQSSSSSPSLFVFGASMVDAGTNAIAMPFRSAAEFDPYGSDYFHRPVGRWSNGRTFMDFLTQSLGLGLLDPFVKSIGSKFKHGVNFASSGSTAQNTSSTTTNSGGLFSLLLQIDQFREYQNALLSGQDSKKTSKLREKFSKSIYFFETAQNDYLQAHIDSDLPQIVKVVIQYMRQAFEVLYTLGARSFIVMNVTPLGCTPSILSETTTMSKDSYNCTSAWNDLASMHNEKLDELLNELRIEYPLAEWIIFDAYNIFLDGYQNSSKYGIKYPFQACCGAGGPYNFNPEATCGKNEIYINGTYVKATKCKKPKLHLIWDFIHPVESFNRHIAKSVLDGTHLIPSFNIVDRFKHVTLHDFA